MQRKGPRRPVMIVDDDDDIRRALEELLRLRGYAVVSAWNGQRALDKLSLGVRPQLILVDLEMPVLDGLQFREAQLKRPEVAHLPVAMYSARRAADARVRALGIEHFFPKPIDVTGLFDFIANEYDPGEDRSRRPRIGRRCRPGRPQVLR